MTPLYPEDGSQNCLRKSFFYARLTTAPSTPTARNTTENGTINSHSQDATALQPSVFLTGIHRSLVIDGWRSDFRLLNLCHCESRSCPSTTARCHSPDDGSPAIRILIVGAMLLSCAWLSGVPLWISVNLTCCSRFFLRPSRQTLGWELSEIMLLPNTGP